MAKFGIKDKKEARNFLFGFIGFIVLFSVIGIPGLLETLDFRFYDFLLKLKKEIPANEKVLVVEIDDKAIEEFGEWPWTRDIMGDALIRMKELGAESMSFDIEYLSPTSKGVSSNARDIISENIYENLNNVVELVASLATAPENGYSVKEIPDLAQELVDSYIVPSFETLQDNIVNNIYNDYDDYFAKAIQFFGNTYVTVNMRDLGIKTDQKYMDYLNKRIARKNVTDLDNKILKGNKYQETRLEGKEVPGFCPTLELFMSHAKSASFTNSVVDDDGIRRRMEFMYNLNGTYYPQLAVGPLLDNLQVSHVTRKGNYYILHDAKFPDSGKPVDLKIPLDQNGYFVINWRHGQIEESFKYESLLDLKLLDVGEDNIRSLLTGIASMELLTLDGELVSVCDAAYDLLDFYNEILDDRDYLLSLCTGYDENGTAKDGIAQYQYDNYFGKRSQYFDSVSEFVNAGLEAEALELLDFFIENYPDKAQEFSEYKESLVSDIADLKTAYTSYVDRFETIKKNYNGAYCIVGNTATATTDIGAVPFVRQFENVGIHANVMNTILEQNFIHHYSWYWIFIFSVIVSLVPLFITKERNAFHNTISAIITAVLITVYILLFILFNIYFPMMMSILYLLTIFLYGVIFRFISSDREKKFLTDAFSQCTSPEVVQEIIDDPSKFKLGGEMLEMSAIFTDIQKFSAFSELLNAAEQVALLNFYLTVLSDIILAEGGTIDKYVGDAIVALVGAPKHYEDHAFRACASAIKMNQAEKILNENMYKISQEEKPEDMDNDLYNAFKIMVANDKKIFTRIGVNTGEMVAGYMGSEKKKNYTMMGHNVNLTSRLEGVNKAYATKILCSEAAFNAADSGENKNKIVFRRLDRVRVINIATPVQLYNIIGFKAEVPVEQLKEIDMFHTALDLYLERNFIEAGKLFIKADKVYPDDTALIFAERCKKFIENPVSDDWDGVLNMTTK